MSVVASKTSRLFLQLTISLGWMGSGCGPRVDTQSGIAAARANISRITTALEAYRIDTARLPDAVQGLPALVVSPAGVNGWRGPYIESVPLDPWGHPYVYRCPGKGDARFDVFSVGPDGKEGTVDDIH